MLYWCWLCRWTDYGNFASFCPDITINVVDLNKERIEKWNGELNALPVFEPELDEVIKTVRNKNLFFSTDVQRSIAAADMIFISVNTPIKTKGIGAGQASDLSWVESSTREISKYAKGHTIVVEKSTYLLRLPKLFNQFFIHLMILNHLRIKLFQLSQIRSFLLREVQ